LHKRYLTHKKDGAAAAVVAAGPRVVCYPLLGVVARRPDRQTVLDVESARPSTPQADSTAMGKNEWTD